MLLSSLSLFIIVVTSRTRIVWTSPFASFGTTKHARLHSAKQEWNHRPTTGLAPLLSGATRVSAVSSKRGLQVSHSSLPYIMPVTEYQKKVQVKDFWLTRVFLFNLFFSFFFIKTSFVYIHERSSVVVDVRMKAGKGAIYRGEVCHRVWRRVWIDLALKTYSWIIRFFCACLLGFLFCYSSRSCFLTRAHRLASVSVCQQRFSFFFWGGGGFLPELGYTVEIPLCSVNVDWFDPEIVDSQFSNWSCTEERKREGGTITHC